MDEGTQDWRAHESQPGIEILSLGEPGRDAAPEKRRLRAALNAPQSLADWPRERRALLLEWLKQTRSEHPKWMVLLDWAGPKRQHLAVEALLGLLLRGWIEIEEVSSRIAPGSWQPKSLTWRDLSALREEMGLADPAAEKAKRENLRWFGVTDERLLALSLALAGSTSQSVPSRRQLCDGLAQWLAQGRSGTRSQFAQFVRSRTRLIHDAEWQWLNEHVDLAACGISAHAPLLTLGGNCTLVANGWVMLDLSLLPQHVAMTPANVATCDQIIGIQQITIVENLSAFASVCQQAGAGELVIWLPGYVAPWWLDSVRHLLALAKVPVRISCDCDPWGIELALKAGALASQTGGIWQPWPMDEATLMQCDHRLPLTDADRRKLETLLAGKLPSSLAGLAQSMDQLSQKAGQEQYL
ncbi:hypothetical protein [Silvimonas soli]|uniref:hypothetical protein n=1 Tax=Silvimonas soli TaxID=2980100 RepID=UPI0024B35735|nr:hypothetical protein [Silvimonas soli]